MNMPNHLGTFYLMIKIEDAVRGVNNNLLAIAIQDAIQTKPARLIVQSVKEMAEDNRDMIIGLLGQDLTNKIINHDC